MPLPKLILRQLQTPAGLLGRLVLRQLNRANRAMNDTPLRLLPVSRSDRVLEIGFGGGDLLGKILTAQPARLFGLETSSLAIDVLSSRYAAEIDAGRLKLVSGDASCMPFADGELSKVYCVNVIYFWRDLEQVLQEIARITATPGSLALCYQEYGPDRADRIQPSHIEQTLKGAGFATAKTSSAHDRSNGDYFCTIAVKSVRDTAEPSASR